LSGTRPTSDGRKPKEARAVERGSTRCTLSSTETARRFYLAASYVEARPPASVFGTQAGYPMTKDLAPASKTQRDLAG